METRCILLRITGSKLAAFILVFVCNLRVLKENYSKQVVLFKSIWIVLGGRLIYGDDGRLLYHSGRSNRDTMEQWDGEKWITPDWLFKGLWMQFTNNRAAQCYRGFGHWGNRAEVYNFESHDCSLGAVVFGQSVVADSLIEGNSAWGKGPINRYGFQVRAVLQF
jgi:hypothetical protein